MNALSYITADPLAEVSWALRWEACKGTALENACLVSFTTCGDAELECHAVAALDDPDARAEAIGYMEDLFAAWDAEEAYDEACHAYEVRTGRSCDDATSPLWDREAWIAGRAA